MTPYYSNPIGDTPFGVGDILVKSTPPDPHVVSCVDRSAGPPPSNNIWIIHATGRQGVNKVVWEPSTITYWANRGYSRRRLNPH